MAKSRINQQFISFRDAKPEDAKFASRLLFRTFPKEAAFIIGLGSEERARKILVKIFTMQDHRFSYEFTHIILHQRKPVGLITSFPGGLLTKLDRHLGIILLRQYRLRGKLAMIMRAYPLIFIKEATRQEYFLNNLAVRKDFRNKGVGQIALAKVETLAQEAGLDRISLIVDIENQSAKRFYERNSFKMQAIHLESNRRVPHLGPGYQRMVKRLD